MRQEVKVLRPFKRYKVGDTFQVSAAEARVLVALNRVEIIKEPNKALQSSPVKKNTAEPEVKPPVAPPLPVAPIAPPPVVPQLPSEADKVEPKGPLPVNKPSTPPRPTISRANGGKSGKGE